MRNVVPASFPDDVRSLPLLRKVLSIPPFFSGLGVLEPLRGCSPIGGIRFGETEVCRLYDRGTSCPELFLLRYDGLVCFAGRAGNEGAGEEAFGRRRSSNVVGGIVSPPSQDLLLDVGVSAGFDFVSRDSLLLEGPSFEPSASFDASKRLFFNASNRSTRSLHCNSIFRNESCSALSVSVRGL